MFQTVLSGLVKVFQISTIVFGTIRSSLTAEKYWARYAMLMLYHEHPTTSLELDCHGLQQNIID